MKYYASNLNTFYSHFQIFASDFCENSSDMADGRILERFRRSKTELTQKKFAKEIGVSSSTYKRIVDGESPLTLELLERIAKIFKVDLTDLTEQAIPSVDEPKESYGPLGTTSLIVVLDGTRKTLDGWIRRLEAINSAM